MKYTSESLLQAMSYVGEDLIHDADQTPAKRRHLPWAAGLVCAAALALAVLTLPQPEQEAEIPPDPDDADTPSSTLLVNWNSQSDTDAAGALLADMDIEIRAISGEALSKSRLDITAWDATLEEFAEIAEIGSDALLSALEPKFSLTCFFTRAIRSTADGPYDLIHDYCMELTAECSGTAVVSLSALGEPLRCCLILDETPLVSHIGETELIISGYQSENREHYLTRFESGGVWYDIETDNITLEDLQFLLETLLLKRETDETSTEDVEVCPESEGGTDVTDSASMGEPNYHDAKADSPVCRYPALRCPVGEDN